MISIRPRACIAGSTSKSPLPISFGADQVSDGWMSQTALSWRPAAAQAPAAMSEVAAMAAPIVVERSFLIRFAFPSRSRRRRRGLCGRAQGRLRVFAKAVQVQPIAHQDRSAVARPAGLWNPWPERTLAVALVQPAANLLQRPVKIARLAMPLPRQMLENDYQVVAE